ncbi:hypothetical protein [Bdellovibrio reynosensis]|uniref:Uncharacterized protein n=1 Tax=Bdellovibrio reynosensis TaxID=2835041 RepID=A0ABY4C7X4_9BACT|nr:hypothetical protein [Bdellovibrio reynosensis]UOF00978.1 hypothetical protein MNR06_14850 [Bdellovibrio reynosensis]
MGFDDNKLETAIIGFSIVLVAGLGFLLKTPVQSALGYQNVSYEMPRPKASFLASLFDLGDREIERKYVNPFDKKKADAKKAAVDPKAAKTNVAKAPAPAPKQADKKADERQKNVDVQVVGSDPSVDLGDFDKMADNSQVPGNYSDVGAANKKNNIPAEEAKTGLTADQWRALLQAQPTKENVTKLVAAFSNKEIDDQTFYMISSELLRNNQAEVQKLGLAAVQSFYSVKSFALVSQSYNQLTPELQSQAHNYLLTYAVSSRMGILMAALQSRDVVVVTSATQIVMEGHQKAKEGVLTSADPRNQRGDVTTNSISGYAKFLPVFQQLAQYPDSSISGLANSALSQIQGAVAAL